MHSNFNELIERIKAVDEPGMLQIIADTERELNKDFFPQVLIVSNASTKKEIIGILSDLIGSTHAVLDDVATAENDYIVRIQYGDDWNGNGLSDTGSGLDVTDISIPWDVLKSLNILWMCCSSLKNIPNGFVTNSDKILLVTNATMAMTQEEKDFLANARKSFSNGEPITISLCNKQLLNTQEDFDDLCANVTKLIAQYGESTKLIDDFHNALCNQFGSIDGEQLKIKREKRILFACLNTLEAYINSQLELAEVDIDKLNEAVKKIEKERKSIEFSGKLVLNSTIENMYGEMKNKILSAADRYSDDACASIRARLAVSKTIEKDINNIAPYLKSVWANFEREIGKHMASEQEQIASVLEQQISSDCKKIVDILEVNSFGDTINISTTSLLSDISFGDVDESKAKKNTMITKGMLVTSIALAFVNPLWGLAAIAGTSVFSMSNNKNLEEEKANVLSALPNECNRIKYGVEGQIEAAIETAKKASCDNVWKVYSEVLDNLMSEMFRYLEQIKAAKEKTGILQSILSTEVLNAKTVLNSN